MTKAEWFGEVLKTMVEIGSSDEQCERVGEILAEWEMDDG